MLLYLVQHGEAKSESEDPMRPLSGQGERDVSKVAFYVSTVREIEVESIFHSTKLRALQTAEIIKEYIASRTGLTEVGGVMPMDDPEIWAERLKGIDKNVVIVGHLPHLARLSSLLLCGNPDSPVIDFKMGGMVCLRREEGRWAVEWMVVPEMVK